MPTWYSKTQSDTLLAGKDPAGAATAAQAAAIQRGNHTGTQPTSTVTGLDTALAAKADLVGGLIPTSQIPSVSLENAVVVVNRAAMLALTTTQVQPGDIAVDTSTGTTRGSYILTATDPTQLANWLLLNAPLDAVQTVNGQSGTVVLAKADVGLGSVDNTADTAKPVSTAQAAADTAATSAAQASSAQRASNLSDLANPATARTNLGLGTAATHPATDFDVAGAAAAAVAGYAPLVSPTFTGTPTVNGNPLPTLPTTKRATLSLGAAGENGNNTVITDWNQRSTVLLPVTPTRFRFKFANFNLNTNAVVAQAVSVTGVWMGDAAYQSSNGQPALAFKATPTSVLGAFTVPADGSDVVSAWITNTGQITAHKLALASYGATSTAANQAMGAGGGETYYGTGASLQAGNTTNSTGSFLGTLTQLDVRIEYEFVGTNKVGLIIGDSLSSGVGDTPGSLPEQTWGGSFGIRNNIAIVNAAVGGMMTSNWTTSTHRKWTRFDLTTTVPDFAIICLGSNDVANGRTAAQAETDYTTIVNYLRNTVGIPRIMIATVPPRNLGATPEAVRTTLNAWIGAAPLGVEAVFDFDRALRDVSNKVVIESGLVSGDATHPMARGQQLMAQTVALA